MWLTPRGHRRTPGCAPPLFYFASGILRSTSAKRVWRKHCTRKAIQEAPAELRHAVLTSGSVIISRVGTDLGDRGELQRFVSGRCGTPARIHCISEKETIILLNRARLCRTTMQEKEMIWLIWNAQGRAHVSANVLRSPEIDSNKYSPVLWMTQ